MQRFSLNTGISGWARTGLSLAASLAWSVSGIALTTSAALAQQPGDDGDEVSAKTSIAVDTIIVTAQKREQNYLDVPLSVTAISESVLELQNIDSLADYAIRVPGLTYDQAGIIGYRGGESITLRGVSGRTNYYIDETPLPITDIRIFDITRIEILRGPQGTLYGDAAMGGTVKIITNKPSVDKFEAGFASGYAFTKDGSESFFTEGFTNLPVSDRMAIRLTGYYEDVAGFIDNTPPASGLGDQTGGFLPFASNVQKDINGGSRRGVRAALRFLASEKLTIDLSGWLQETKLDARSLFDDGTPLQTANFGENFEEQDFQFYNATLTWESDIFNITSSSTYYNIDTINTEDLSVFLAVGSLGLDAGIFSNAQQLNNHFPSMAFSHESRISFQRELMGIPVYGIGGVFYKTSEGERNQFWFDSQSIADINATGAFPFDFGLLFDLQGIERGLWASQLINMKTDQLAFFGEISIEPFPHVEITGGLRYFEFDVTQSRIVDGFVFSGFEEESGITSDSGVNPRVGVKVEVTEDAIVYANLSKGFNIGTAIGSALPSVCDAQLTLLGLDDGPVDPETLWSYEAGAKGSFLNGRLVVDASGYYIDWSDIQESIQLDTSTCPESLLGNFGDAEIYGGELSFTATPIQGLDITGSIGYTDVDRSRPAIGVNAAELIGNTLLTTSIQAQYSFPVSDGMSGYVGGDYQYIEEGEIDEPGTPHYSVSNVRFGIISSSGWEASFVGRNIFNAQPSLVSIPSGTAGTLSPQIATLRPRTLGVEMRARF